MRIKKTQRKRRVECKTDYLARLKMLKSGKPRLVFRKTNSYLIAQYVVSEEAQDKVVFGATSKDLIKYGWPENFKGSLKSIPASYLFGILVSKKIQKEKLEEPIVDLGLQRVLYKTKIFSFIKGLIDGGLNIPCPEEAFPERERIEGKSLKEDFGPNFNKVKEKVESL